MVDFVRICPRCSHANPEYESACSSCNHFIGMEAAVPRPAPASTDPPPADALHSPSPAPTDPDPAVDDEGMPSATGRFAPQDESFYLELVGSEQVFTVKSGWCMGQAHETNEAEIQIPAELAGCDFIHRQHCRFEHRDGTWVVVPIPQAELGQDFTNPTYVNQDRLQPGEAAPIHHGDVVRLSGVRFTVRFIR